MARCRQELLEVERKGTGGGKSSLGELESRKPEFDPDLPAH
jgi:hypothetical protein